MNVRVLAEGTASGAANMARDEGLARALAAGGIGPTIRLYGWAPPCLSIGFHQDEGDFDRGALARLGVDLVRRPTGGRAILHWHEVTYCALVPLAAGSPRAIYGMLNEALLAGIRSMGIPAELAGPGPALKAAYASPSGIPCFTVSVKSEIQVGGRKLVGSAQRRYGDAVLQHGSFLLGAQHREIAGLVRAAAPGPRAAIAAAIAGTTTEAESVLGRVVSHEEASAALAAGFERYFSDTPDIPRPSGAAPVFATSH